jgi:L-fuconolactonase
MKNLVDTHVHIWDLQRAEYPWLVNDKSILKRTWNIEQLEDERIRVGVTEGILVQAAGNMEDSELMFETAASTSWISGVVAWLPLLDLDKCERVLTERYLKEKYFKGVRHQVHDEPDPKWLLQEEVLESLEMLQKRNIPYDAVGILNDHIETVLDVMAKLPGLRMVFDHLNQPPIKKKEKFGKWGTLMIEASKNKNLYAKISGLGTASGDLAEWGAEDIKPYVEFILENFGVDRVFCGGDWPVSNLAGSYSRTWRIYKQVIDELLNENDREKIYYSNAKIFYSL